MSAADKTASIKPGAMIGLPSGLGSRDASRLMPSESERVGEFGGMELRAAAGLPDDMAVIADRTGKVMAVIRRPGR